MTHPRSAIMFALCLALIFPWVALAQSDDTQTYTSADSTITLQYPADWSLKPTLSMLILTNHPRAHVYDPITPGMIEIMVSFNIGLDGVIDATSPATVIQHYLKSGGWSNPRDVKFSGHSGLSIELHQPESDIQVIALDLGASQPAVIVITTAANELSNFEPQIKLIADTLIYTSPPAETAQALPNGELVYVANGQIQIMDVAHSNAHALTDGEAESFMPKWSADGTKIVFARDTADGTAQIYVMDADGSNVFQLTHTDTNSLEPTWSPDGKKIVFITGRGRQNHEIFAMDADGSNLRRLTHNEVQDEYPAWSPDGKRIAFIEHQPYDETRGDLYIMNADGTGSQRIMTDVADDQTPVWSPDGIRILFSSAFRDMSLCALYIVDADGSHLAPVIRSTSPNVPFYCEYPTWSPDGTQIAFTAIPTANYERNLSELYLVNADGTHIRRLTDNNFAEWEVSWRP